MRTINTVPVAFNHKRTTCICPTTKLASFLFKERRLSQASLELSSSREVFGSLESKRKRGEKREKQNPNYNTRIYLQKMKTYKISSPPNSYLGLQKGRGLYRPPQYMKIYTKKPNNLAKLKDKRVIHQIWSRLALNTKT